MEHNFPPLMCMLHVVTSFQRAEWKGGGVIPWWRNLTTLLSQELKTDVTSDVMPVP